MSRAGLSLVLLMALTACVRQVRPPPQVQDPVTVYLVENDMHGGLVLPTDHGTVIQYDYGDWNYYAMNDKSISVTFSSLFWPSTGCLARREVAFVPQDILAVRRRLYTDKAIPLQVERARCAALVDDLERRFASQIATYHYDATLDTGFVADPQDYDLCHTCNHVVNDWLQRLGCTTAGWFWSWEYGLAP